MIWFSHFSFLALSCAWLFLAALCEFHEHRFSESNEINMCTIESVVLCVHFYLKYFEYLFSLKLIYCFSSQISSNSAKRQLVWFKFICLYFSCWPENIAECTVFFSSLVFSALNGTLNPYALHLVYLFIEISFLFEFKCGSDNLWFTLVSSFLKRIKTNSNLRWRTIMINISFVCWTILRINISFVCIKFTAHYINIRFEFKFFMSRLKYDIWSKCDVFLIRFLSFVCLFFWPLLEIVCHFVLLFMPYCSKSTTIFVIYLLLPVCATFVDSGLWIAVCIFHYFLCSGKWRCNLAFLLFATALMIGIVWIFFFIEMFGSFYFFNRSWTSLYLQRFSNFVVISALTATVNFLLFLKKKLLFRLILL